MEKWLIKFFGISLLSLLLFISGATFGNHGVKASQKRTYQSETTTPNGLQQLLTRRASEGWRFVAVSEGSQDGSNVLVVVFDRE
jgi:hypothetical protein